MRAADLSDTQAATTHAQKLLSKALAALNADVLVVR